MSDYQNLPGIENSIDETFIRDNGWRYKTKDSLECACERFLKCKNNMLITQDEFVTEAWVEGEEVAAAKAVYNALVSLVAANKLRPADVYSYAHYRWCLRDPGAIIAYQTGHNRHEINDCGTKITHAEAKIAINGEWGFEASRIKIIGTPYYDATDYHFIRFDCARMCWLWKNGNLYEVCE